MGNMTRNRQSVLLTQALDGAKQISIALAGLPPDKQSHVHSALNQALHCALIAAEEIRQEWAAPRELDG